MGGRGGARYEDPSSHLPALPPTHPGCTCVGCADTLKYMMHPTPLNGPARAHQNKTKKQHAKKTPNPNPNPNPHPLPPRHRAKKPVALSTCPSSRGGGPSCRSRGRGSPCACRRSGRGCRDACRSHGPCGHASHGGGRSHGHDGHVRRGCRGGESPRGTPCEWVGVGEIKC